MNRSAEPLLGTLTESRFAPSWGSALRGGSWPQLTSIFWRSSLSMNRKVGRGVLTPPQDLQDATVSRGAVRTPRPTRLRWPWP